MKKKSKPDKNYYSADTICICDRALERVRAKEQSCSETHITTYVTAQTQYGLFSFKSMGGRILTASNPISLLFWVLFLLRFTFYYSFSFILSLFSFPFLSLPPIHPFFPFSLYT